MRNLARIGMLGAAIGLGSFAALGVAALGAAADAGADSGAPYTVKATGTALKITVAGTSLVGGTSSASAGQGAAATAEGVGELTPAVVSDQKATAPSANASQSLTRQCAQPTTPFPAPVGSLLNLGIGCSTATASQDGNGLPTASASGSIASLTVGAPTSALPIPVDPGSALATALEGVLGNVPLPALPSTGLPFGDSPRRSRDGGEQLDQRARRRHSRRVDLQRHRHGDNGHRDDAGPGDPDRRPEGPRRRRRPTAHRRRR